MQLEAKYSSKCPECGEQIQQGDDIHWTPDSKARHWRCRPDKEEESGEREGPDRPAIPSTPDNGLNEPKHDPSDYPFERLQEVDYQGTTWVIADLKISDYNNPIALLTRSPQPERGRQPGEPVVLLDELLEDNQPDNAGEPENDPEPAESEPDEQEPAEAEADVARNTPEDDDAELTIEGDSRLDMFQ